jgi:uncharacterized protein (TIGR02271 family)
MISQNDIQRISGAEVYTTGGDKIGSAGQVYLDNQSGNPEWVSVKTGLFGTKESFVPLQGATVTGDRVEVQYSKEQVKDAPRIDVDGDLSPAQEDELYNYYGLSSTGGDTYSGDDRGDTSGPNTDDAMTRSEEQLHAGKETVTAGKARLRKWVETEEQNVSVPVKKEKARLETEPITDANRGSALDGPAISEEEHEVTLTEERPVVAKEAVPVERVRLTKDSEEHDEQVSEEVRKERIDAEGDVDNSPGTRR